MGKPQTSSARCLAPLGIVEYILVLVPLGIVEHILAKGVLAQQLRMRALVIDLQ